MLRTSFCDLFGLEVPVIQAAIPPYTSPELVAAVSNAGGLGSYACAFRTVDQVKQDVARIRELTDKPFAMNFLMPVLDPEVFDYVVSVSPPVISFAVANPGARIQQAREAGAKIIAQAHTVEQSRELESAGAAAIIAQGAEAGGLSGSVALMPLLPQVVDTVAPVPVIAAGGIADGRGLAAALVLGAQGVNVGTRFIASEEAWVDEGRRQRVLDARSEDTMRATILNKVAPMPEGTYDTSLRSLRTNFLDQWEDRETIAQEDLDGLRREMQEASESNRLEAYFLAAGQSVGLIHDVLPASEIVQRMVSEAESALAKASGFTAPMA